MPRNNSDQPRLKDIRYMGYSVRSERYRYTEWVGFDRAAFRPDWSEVVGAELYDHGSDPGEDMNVAGRSEYAGVRRTLRKILRGQHQFRVNA